VKPNFIFWYNSNEKNRGEIMATAVQNRIIETNTAKDDPLDVETIQKLDQIAEKLHQDASNHAELACQFAVQIFKYAENVVDLSRLGKMHDHVMSKKIEQYDGFYKNALDGFYKNALIAINTLKACRGSPNQLNRQQSYFIQRAVTDTTRDDPLDNETIAVLDQIAEELLQTENNHTELAIRFSKTILKYAENVVDLSRLNKMCDHVVCRNFKKYADFSSSAAEVIVTDCKGHLFTERQLNFITNVVFAFDPRFKQI